MIILDLVTCLGEEQRVIMLVTLTMTNHIQNLWKAKLDTLIIERTCLWTIVSEGVGHIMGKLRSV